jgi:hypothetical protein
VTDSETTLRPRREEGKEERKGEGEKRKSEEE